MANKTFQGRIVQKHDTEANWKKAINFIPLKGEIIIYDKDEYGFTRIKIGDGATKINDLPFLIDYIDNWDNGHGNMWTWYNDIGLWEWSLE